MKAWPYLGARRLRQEALCAVDEATNQAEVLQ